MKGTRPLDIITLNITQGDGFYWRKRGSDEGMAYRAVSTFMNVALLLDLEEFSEELIQSLRDQGVLRE